MESQLLTKDFFTNPEYFEAIFHDENLCVKNVVLEYLNLSRYGPEAKFMIWSKDMPTNPPPGWLQKHDGDILRLAFSAIPEDIEIKGWAVLSAVDLTLERLDGWRVRINISSNKINGTLLCSHLRLENIDTTYFWNYDFGVRVDVWEQHEQSLKNS